MTALRVPSGGGCELVVFGIGGYERIAQRPYWTAAPVASLLTVRTRNSKKQSIDVTTLKPSMTALWVPSGGGCELVVFGIGGYEKDCTTTLLDRTTMPYGGFRHNP